jgi:RNA 2',3'-cyclic 3'-phosphodiesterase
VGKRLFVAVDVDAATRNAVDELTQALRQDARIQRAGRATWVNKDRMHLTLHFQADADASTERGLLDSLAHPIPHPPFNLSFQSLGFFPERGAPRVLWLGIGQGLDRLRGVHHEISRRLGLRDTSREPFHPHLTLARFRDRVSRSRLAEITAFPAVAGPAPIDRVTLYESRLSPKGPTYTALAEALLKAPL